MEPSLFLHTSQPVEIPMHKHTYICKF